MLLLLQSAINYDGIVSNLLQSESMMWQQELFIRFDYKNPTSYFHTFDSDVRDFLISLCHFSHFMLIK